MKKTLHLFTDVFPYKGGEPFLETEIQFLSKAFDVVCVYPASPKNDLIAVPDNVVVNTLPLNGDVSPRKIIAKYWLLLLKWYFNEFVQSPHRFKYIGQFKWNFYRLIGLITNAEKVKQHLESEKAIYIYSYWFNDWGSILALCKQMGLSSKIITRTHGYDFDEQQQGRGYHPFRYTELPLFNKIIQVSEYGHRYLKARFNKSTAIATSYLGVIDRGINPLRQPEDKTLRVVSCSNFVPLKRVEMIAEILQHFQLPYHWTHFGDGIEKAAIIKKVHERISPENVSFKGYVANKDLMHFYQTEPVDVFINASYLEGLPVSLMEAISFGIPIVGCNICGVPEIVNSTTGVLLERNFDARNAAMAITAMLSKSDTELKNFRSEIRTFWEKKFNAANNYPQFINQYLLNQ
ncbi:MAG: glycosyltransferase [Bacteroidota bacterium]